MTTPSDLLPDLLAALDKLDCGDNSCSFAMHKGGMRTNGGCRCLGVSGRSAERAVVRILRRMRMAAEMAKAADVQDARASIVAWLRNEAERLREAAATAVSNADACDRMLQASAFGEAADCIERREDEATPIGDDTGAGKMTPVSETDPVERARVSGFKSGRRSERAAIVAWLRKAREQQLADSLTDTENYSLHVDAAFFAGKFADATERGEHAVRPGRLDDDDGENAR